MRGQPLTTVTMVAGTAAGGVLSCLRVTEVGEFEIGDPPPLPAPPPPPYCIIMARAHSALPAGNANEQKIAPVGLWDCFGLEALPGFFAFLYFVMQDLTNLASSFTLACYNLSVSAYPLIPAPS